MDYPRLVLNKDKEFSLQRLHPWVFSGAIAKKPSSLQEGDIVEIYSSRSQYLATGYYANGSIAVRILSFEQTPIDLEFWVRRIEKAWNYRQHLNILNKDTNVCRLFFGEGDGAPGLIIDYYAGHAVIQAHSWGIYLQLKHIALALERVLGANLLSIYDKSAESIVKEFSSQTENGFLYGKAQTPVEVLEHGQKFIVDFIGGQKTGFFVDQRENRLLLSRYCRDKMVLNTFSYTGGFSVYAASTAQTVHSVDVSAPAIELCNRNIALNGFTNHQGFAADTFDFLKDKQNVYDVIVLDPPAFAKSRDSKHNAVIGYKRLNAMAMKLIKPNGIIFTFSCSGVVDKMLFYNTIAAAAMEAKRGIKVLNYLSQPADHPVIPYFPEGEYLKGMVLFVE